MHKFVCSCCNATYYEESERQFFIRASEHLGMTWFLLTGVNFPCNFHDILSFVDSSSLLFENASMTEGSESLFCWNKHELVEKLLLILIVFANTNSNLVYTLTKMSFTDICFITAKFLHFCKEFGIIKTPHTPTILAKIFGTK